MYVVLLFFTNFGVCVCCNRTETRRGFFKQHCDHRLSRVALALSQQIDAGFAAGECIGLVKIHRLDLYTISSVALVRRHGLAGPKENVRLVCIDTQQAHHLCHITRKNRLRLFSLILTYDIEAKLNVPTAPS